METLSLPEKYRNMVAPDAPETVEAVRFKARFDRKRHEFLAAVWPHKDGGWAIWIRPLESQHSDLFSFKCPVDLTPTSEPLERRRLIQKIARDHISSGEIGSFVPMEGFSCCFELSQITLRRERDGWIYRESFFTKTIFAPFEVLTLPEEELKSRFLKAIETNETARTVWQLFNTDKPERRDFILHCENGDWTQIKAQLELLNCVVATELEMHPHLEWDWQKGRFRNDTKKPFPFLNLWCEALREFYKPRFLLRNIKEIPTMGTVFLSEFRIEPREFSAHEKLEAQLQLCEWATTHFPDRPELLEFPD